MAYTDIDKPTDYFNTKLYSGDGASTQAITGVNFRPDFVWIKSRNYTENHMLSDAVRGSTKRLRSDTTNAEDDLGSNGIQSFNTDGFTAGDGDAMNASGQTYASWNWLASNTTASNTDGSITSTVSANTTSGFSIVSYTGTGSNATVGHGLGSDVSMVIIKNRDDTNNWFVHHKDLGGVACLNLDTTDASFSPGTSAFQNPPLTSSFIQLATNVSVNNSGQNYIAYCFAEKKGFSRFGSYQGNGSNDGSYIHLGFKPSFLMTKRTDTTSEWVIFDNKRDSFNQVQKFLQPNLSDAEGNDNGSSSGKQIDFLSNGWKMRGTTAGMNASGGTYIYMAFAENPFVTSTGIPTTAR